MVNKLKELLFQNTTLKQTVAKNTFWLSAGQIVSRLIRAALVIYAARVLGTAGYGVLSYALSLAGFFTVLSDLGLSGLLTRELIQKKEQIETYLSTTFVLRLATTLISALIILFAVPFLVTVKEVTPLLPIVIFLILFDSLRNYGISIVRSENRMELEAFFNIITEFFITGLGITIILINPTTTTLLIAYAAGSGLGLSATVFTLRSQFKKAFKKFQLALVKPILTAAWPFSIMGLFGNFIVNIDVLIIGAMRNAHELGLYSAANRIIQLLYVIPGIFGASLFPILSRLVQAYDYQKIKTVIEKALTAVLMIALPIAVGGFLLAAPLINLIFGEEYLGATIPLQLLLLTVLLVFPGTIIGNIIFAHNRQNIFIISTTLGIISNIVLDVILISLYGIVGAAMATIVVETLANGFNYYKLKKINDFRVLQYLKKIVVAVIIMGVFSFAIERFGINVILNIIASAGVYFGILYLLKEKTIFEIKSLIRK